MKKIISLAAVMALGALLLAGCGSKPAANQTNNTDAAAGQTGNTNADQTAKPKAEETFSGSLNELMKRGQPTKCTFNYAENGSIQQGEVYISGDKARVNTTMTADGKASQVYVIKKATEYYMWGSEMPGKGTKFVFTEADEKALQEKSQTQEANKNVDFNKKGDYKCGIWLADNSLFNVPANIEFTDMTSLLKDMMNQNSGMQQEICKMCDNLPAGAAKDNCVKTNCK